MQILIAKPLPHRSKTLPSITIRIRNLILPGSDMFNRNMRLYAMKHGHCLIDHGICNMEYGLWNMQYGIWKTEEVAGYIMVQG